MQNIVISLSTAIARREHIKQQFEKHQLNYEFFDAITPDQAVVLATKLNLNFDSKLLTTGELACFMSHVSLWKKMVDEDIPYLSIFEDDIFLGENADYFLTSSDWIDPTWDILKIEAFAKKTLLSSKIKSLEQSSRSIFQLQDKNLGTAGYILSQQGAKLFLNYVQDKVLLPLDEMIFQKFIADHQAPVYQMNPALCIQEMLLLPQQATLDSKLSKERQARMRSNKKKGMAKVRVELLRLLKQIRYALFAQKITFK